MSRGAEGTARAGRSIARARERTAIDRETTARVRQRIACGRDTVARGNVRTAFGAARRAFWNESIARRASCPARRTPGRERTQEFCGPIYARLRERRRGWSSPPGPLSVLQRGNSGRAYERPVA